MSRTTARKIIKAVVEKAESMLSSRQHYARDVLAGNQLWSGADLKGVAKKFGAGYAKQRGCALKALRAAGGEVQPCENGLMQTVVSIGMDDYGNAIYAAADGIKAPSVTGKRLAAI